MRRAAVVLAVAVALAAGPARAAPPRQRPPGHGLVIAGVTSISLGVAGWVLMAVGLGLGNAAQSDVQSLGRRGDIDHRRHVMAHGRLGNGLAIGGGAAAAALLAAGIPLVVIGRRRARAAAARRGTVGWLPLRGGGGLTWRLRF